MPPSEYYPTLWPRVTDQWVWGAGDGPDPNGWEGQAGSCVANAVANLKEIHEYRQYGTANKYSIGHIFGNRTGSESDSGMQIEDALDRTKYDGVPLFRDLIENAYPYYADAFSPYTEYDYSNDRKWIYPDTYMYFDWVDGSEPMIGARTLVNNHKYRDIYRSKISSWSNIDASGILTTELDAIKQNIIDNGAALVHTYIANNFANLGGDGCTGIVPATVDYNLTIGESKTTHLMCVLGWKLVNGSTHWIVNNNWGDWWWGDENRRGVCYMPIYYSNIIQYYTAIDDLLRQNTPAPIECYYAPDSQYPNQYINAHSPAWENDLVGVLAFDKKLNYGTYADRWIGSDIYNGTEKYHDISLMTDGQTVQFRSRFIDVPPWLTQAGGAELWGWAYSDVYVKSGARPTNFAGFDWIYSGGDVYSTVDNGDGTYTAYIITHAEWNNFTSKINEFREYKNLSPYSFTNAYTDLAFSSTVMNQAVVAINDMGFSISGASGDISADFLVVQLKGNLNSIT